MFGHVHETYGSEVIDGTTFMNASSVDYEYKPVNAPFVINLPKK